MVQPIGRNEIQQLAESVRKRDLESLKQVVPETLLNLDQALNYRFVVDSTFLQILKEIRDGLDLQTRITQLDTQLTDATLNTFGVPKGLDIQIAYYENKIHTITTTDLTTLEGSKLPRLSMINNTGSSKDDINKAKNALSTIEGQIQAKNSEINTYKSNIDAAKTKKDQVEQEKKELETFWNTYKNIIGTTATTGTRKRLADLITIGEVFEINNLIPRQNYGIGQPTTTITTQLNPLFAPTLGAQPISYVMCNSQTGEAIPNSGGALEVTTDGGQAIKLKGIQITGNTVEFNNIQVDPITGLNFPINLRLAIRGRIQDPVTGMNMDHFKNLDITINQPNFNQTARQTEVDACNNAGAGNIIKNSMDSLSATSLAKREREAIFRAISNKDGPKFDKLSNEQKEDMYQVARRLIKPPTGESPLILGTNLDYNHFRAWVTGDKHPSNAPENILNPMAYRNYINNNLETLIPEFFAKQMDKEFIDDIDRNTFLKSEVTRYLSEIENQKIDNDVHQRIEGDINAVDEMENRRRFGKIGRKDVNYLRFFDSKLDIKDQTVNITTNNKPEDLNNPEPVKYDMNMEVSGKQQIAVNIKIGKQKEIKLKAGDPAAMVRKILQCEDIQHGKVRGHVVYNLMKGFIETAKKKDISLTYRDPRTGDMMVIKMDGKNIILEQQDDHTNAGGTHRRNTTVLFDQQYFENTNTFESTIPDDNRSLRIGIDKMMGHFNFAMNEVHYQYRQASERRWMGLRRGETRITLPTSFWLSPIKKLINLGTTTKFDFSTTIQSNGKSVSIGFEKNKFTLNMAGLKKPISSRTLGKLLRYREGGVRVFDGMERDICGKIYEEMIKKMRENTKIARTNFGVKDYITGRTYILDSDGQMGYVNAEQAAAEPDMVRRGAVSHRDYGVVNNPPAGRTMCDESETREVMKNPFLMGRFIKTMNNRMGIISSTRALLN